MHQISADAVDHASEVLRTTDGMLLPHGFLSGLPYLDLYTDRWVCVVDRDNPAVGEALTMEHFASLPWVVTYHRPTAFTPAVRQRRLLGVEPHVQVVVESFVAVPFLVAGTDRVALVQEHLIRRQLAAEELRVLPCPFDVVPLVEALWWHPMYDRDPEHAWLRAVFAQAGRRVTGAPR